MYVDAGGGQNGVAFVQLEFIHVLKHKANLNAQIEDELSCKSRGVR